MTAVNSLTDRFGRVARDLRVSLTDRCNLRCSYCMPAEGVQWIPTEETLTDDEVVRLISIAVLHLGITQVRFTGGEPLLRKGLESIAERCRKLPQDGSALPMAITTNALGLDRRAEALYQAGITRINASLDSLNPTHYAQIARRDRLADALAGLTEAQRVGMGPIKVNAVIMRGINDHDSVELLRYCLQRGYQLRFIEHMPLGPPHSWVRTDIITAAQLRQQLSQHFQLSPALQERGSAPASLWNVAASHTTPAGQVGFISSVTQPFCDACDRTRITADGQLRTCLFSTTETDLRAPLRSGADDVEIAKLWRAATWHKPAGHGINSPQFRQPDRTMSRIGG